MLWGNESCLRILGRQYEVVWLIATVWETGGYNFWMMNPLECPMSSRARFAMLHCDGEHYEPIFHKDQGVFSTCRWWENLPDVVRDTWRLLDEVIEGECMKK